MAGAHTQDALVRVFADQMRLQRPWGGALLPSGVWAVSLGFLGVGETDIKTPFLPTVPETGRGLGK